MSQVPKWLPTSPAHLLAAAQAFDLVCYLSQHNQRALTCDATSWDSRAAALRGVQEALSLPSACGSNLDALFDGLGDRDHVWPNDVLVVRGMRAFAHRNLDAAFYLVHGLAEWSANAISLRVYWTE
jgi:RNAse (barnase) inhibitor barstar